MGFATTAGLTWVTPDMNPPDNTTMLRIPTAVHTENLPGDVAGLLGDQECARRRDVFRPSHPAYRRHRDRPLYIGVAALLGTAQHRGVDETRRHGVHGDAGRPVLQRQRFGQSVHGRFG